MDDVFQQKKCLKRQTDSVIRRSDGLFLRLSAQVKKALNTPDLGFFNFNHQAYKRQSNSVKIAKITAFTIIVSSFVLGFFILASSYLQAKASCDQVQALDSVLEKELMLETLQQVNKELPRAEALLGKESPDEVDLQNLDSNEPVKKVEIKQKNAPIPTDDDRTDNNYSDTEETEEMQKFPGKVPLELDLSDLAAALLQNNKKSRMNCVVERKHAEEIVDSPSKTVSLPFGMNLTTDPKKARITGERISIYCEGGNENKENEARESSRNNREEDEDTEEDAEPIRPVFIPYQRVPIPFGQIPQQFPLTHMPQRMMPPVQQPQPHMRQMLPPFQQLPMRPPMPPQIMQAPHPESQQQQRMMEPQTQTVRIHVQQLPFREIHVADDVPVQIPAQNQELPQFQVQRLPLGLALQRAGITADDLRNIQRMAEERITDELRRMAAVESSDSAENSNSNSSEEDDSADTQSSGQSSSAEQDSMPPQQPQQPQQPQPQQPQPQQIPQRLILQPLPEQPRDTMIPPMPDQPPQMMQYGRAAYGRSLAQPVRIPVPMMQAQADMSQETQNNAPEERPHFVQPRSV
ncbi:RNA polymerase II degradation factor 1 [Teleopsis dalmanni]|uniref:RNA polymerase II degradation factor 1 n=1 Tax=Teleopsis dalmanni TaxID=139649 RepID=UPI0018CDB644|nr:RNA polymerase II degradation factor 1 [Teleopsis dalmanni]